MTFIPMVCVYKPLITTIYLLSLCRTAQLQKRSRIKIAGNEVKSLFLEIHKGCEGMPNCYNFSVKQIYLCV